MSAIDKARASGGLVKRARSLVDAQNLSMLAKQNGRCGDVNRITGYVCVVQPHEEDLDHIACQIGGANDGYVYARWGGKGAVD